MLDGGFRCRVSGDWMVDGGCGLWVAGCGLRVTGYGLRVAGCGLRQTLIANWLICSTARVMVFTGSLTVLKLRDAGCGLLISSTAYQLIGLSAHWLIGSLVYGLKNLHT